MTRQTDPSYNGAAFNKLLCFGIDGANPLGFLAAVGLLNVMSADDSNTERPLSMRWQPQRATWVPELGGEASWLASERALLDELLKRLDRIYEDHIVCESLELLGNSESDNVFARIADEATLIQRDLTDWIAALGVDDGDGSEGSQLQTVRKDYFRGNLQSVIERTDRSHLQRTLFDTWDYADALDNQSLHWDPSEDRRHALQWNKPSGDPNRKDFGGMLGANRLGIEALPLFTLVPIGPKSQTIGFSGTRANNTRWTWPLWQSWASLPIVKSLLSHPCLQTSECEVEDQVILRQLGVSIAFRCRRIIVGKTPNFTPAERIL